MNRKQTGLLCLLLALLLVTLAACGGTESAQTPVAEHTGTEATGVFAEQTLYTPGTYSGSSSGRTGLVTVTVTVDETSILSVEIDTSAEAPTKGGAHDDEFTQRIMAKQGADIDAVSGATITSNAVRIATAKALAEASGTEYDGSLGEDVELVTGSTLQGQDYVDALTSASPNLTVPMDAAEITPAAGGSRANDEQILLVGAAIRDVTPTTENGLLPMPGLGRLAPDFVGVITPIHTRVIAFQLGETRALMVCTECGKGPMGDTFARIISTHTDIPVEAIFFTSPLAHAAPEVSRGTMTVEPTEGEGNDIKWARATLALICDAADEALENLAPASTSIGVGNSYINVNTVYPYTLEDGSEINTLGFNLAGDTDTTLSVVRFDGEDGEPIAFIVNYPCHGTTMTGNNAYYGAAGIDYDFCGEVSALLEEKYEGAVAMWTSGAAGDLGPFMSNQMVAPDPYTGESSTTYIGVTAIRDTVAKIQYNDVKKILAGSMEQVDVNILAYAEDVTVLPGDESNPDGVTMSLQLLRLGDIAFVGTPGELYHSIGEYMKDNSSLPYMMVVDNTWNWQNSRTGYIPDDAGLQSYDAKGVLGLGGNPGYAVGVINSYFSELANTLIAETDAVA